MSPMWHDSVQQKDPAISILSKNQLIKIRNLYLDRRYKQCIAICDSLDPIKLHSIHKIFLYFHKAISYESLGLIAHRYSTKKIQFLEQAIDSLGSTLEEILEAGTTNSGSTEHSSEPSPLMTTFSSDDTSATEDFLSGDDILNLPTVNDSQRHKPNNTRAYISYAVAYPGNIEHEQRHLIRAQQKPYQNRTPTSLRDTLPQENGFKYKDRLSQRVSFGHVIADDLVPSPLSVRARKIVSNESDAPDGSPMVQQAFTRSPNSNAPFQSIQKSMAFNQQRKTAVQTLISIFEGRLPLKQSPTERRHGNIEHTPSPEPKSSNDVEEFATLSSVIHASNLEKFRSSVHAQLSSIRTLLKEAQEEQMKHKANQQLDKTKHRLASFWTFKTPDLDQTEHKHGELYPKTKIERVHLLKECNWQVRKEKFGWKGEDYYRRLRAAVEAEMK